MLLLIRLDLEVEVGEVGRCLWLQMWRGSIVYGIKTRTWKPNARAFIIQSKAV